MIGILFPWAEMDRTANVPRQGTTPLTDRLLSSLLTVNLTVLTHLQLTKTLRAAAFMKALPA
jgi:hypothetical protein